jgi:hypothetical protein
LLKIEEEFLEEIILAPSTIRRTDKQDGINGFPVGVLLTTQQGENITVDCISSGNKVIWYIYPSP